MNILINAELPKNPTHYQNQRLLMRVLYTECTFAALIDRSEAMTQHDDEIVPMWRDASSCHSFVTVYFQTILN